MDVDGNAIMEDTRKDFGHALRFLRNAEGLVEGASLQDILTHFVVLKSTNPLPLGKAGGRNKLSVWVWNDVLEEWVRMSTFPGKKVKKYDNGAVYFINMESNMKVFKIGYTTNITSRLEDLQVGNPYLLSVYRTIENVPKKLEARLHQHFHGYRIRG